ncbi:MAG: Gfo/Idh/MocA family oxidoreductase [Pirellulaceae bacterium]|nr:Gfo/Idh/MocA family oxidoreductase [Pirellulaceae bacterium]
MTNANYRGAIIGLGFIGGADQVSGDALGQQVADLDGTHLKAMVNHPRVELVAGSSRDQGRRERFVERTSSSAYASWQEMLEQESLDIVSVATYAPQHAEIVRACAARGVRAIFCEKPIATSLPAAEGMVTACEKSGSLLAVNHNRRFHSSFRKLRDLISAGEIGELTSVALRWPSGRLGNVGTHMFNMICMVTGQSVAAVSATLDLSGRPDCRGADFHDPGGWGLLRLANGLVVTFDAGDYANVSPRAEFNGTLGRAIVAEGNGRLEFPDGRVEALTDPPAGESSMDRAMNEIVDCLDGKTTFADPAINSVHTLEVIVACHASHAVNSSWVVLPLSGADREIVVQSG